MKRFLVFLLLLSLLLLSSCKPSKTLQEQYDELLDKYYEIEEKYYSYSSRLDEVERQYADALSEIDRLNEKINSIDNISLDLYEYFDFRTMSFDKASDIFDQLCSVLND